MTTVLRAGGATDTGLVRATNQDSLLVADPLYAVADGMGGHAAGEVASATAVRALEEAWSAAARLEAASLAEAARIANRTVWDAAQADGDLRGMGTTLVAVALVDGAGGEELALVNIGDSRAYRLRDGELSQLTVDHSLVAELVAEGELAEEEAEFHPQRHVLTRALGVDPEVPVDLQTLRPAGGDRILLCSDGLIREVSDRQVAALLRRFADPAEAARELVAEARLRGGSDNITVVIVDVVDAVGGVDAEPAPPNDATGSPPGPDGEQPDQGATAPPTPAEPAPHEPAPREPAPPEPAPPEPAPQPAQPGPTRDADDTSVLAVITSTPDPRASPPGPLTRPRQRILTVRVVGFVVLLLLVLTGAAVGVGLYARGTYYVGVRAGTLTVYRGRPGGVLWFEPTVARTTATPLSAVHPYQRASVSAGVLEPSMSAASAYIARITSASSTPASPTSASSTPASPASASPASASPTSANPGPGGGR